MSDIPNIKILTDAYLNYQESIVNMIYNRFKGRLDMPKVEDIFGNVFLETCTKINEGKLDIGSIESSVKWYLYRACLFQACKAIERNREDKIPEIESGDDKGCIDEGQLMKLMGIVNAHESGNDIVDDCDKDECSHALNQAIDGMKEGCRKIIRERFWDGFSFRLIGQGMNKSEDAAKMQGSRCMKSLINKNKHLLEVCRK